MKTSRRIKNYFITHTDYDFAKTYCDNNDNVKIYNDDTQKSLYILQEVIGKEKSTRLSEPVNAILQ